MTTHTSKKLILQLNIKSTQPVHMDFMIYLHNLGDRMSEKPKRPVCTSRFISVFMVKDGSILRIFGFLGVAKVRSQRVHIDVFHFLQSISMIYQYLERELMCLCWLLIITYCAKVALPAKNRKR